MEVFSIRKAVDSMLKSDEAPRNKIEDRVFIIRIFAYSARKKSANGPPAYSTLKPDTNSDSPSVKSKGARFVSAKVETYHINARGQDGIIIHVCCWAMLKVTSENPPAKRIELNAIRARVTSYEMVCATARSEPIKAYLEFDAHPEPRIV